MNYKNKITLCISFILLDLYLGVANYFYGNRFTAIVCFAMAALWSTELVVDICEHHKRRK